MTGTDIRADITSIPLPDESVDFFICSHVLEHVENDDQAVRELYRITRKGGSGILMAPIIIGLKTTVVNSSATTGEERWRLFGQNDHVRLYAHDGFVNKIKNNGFSVKELGVDYFGDKVFRSLGFKKTSILYLAEKK